MKCPRCGFTGDKVTDSRHTSDGEETRRRRECTRCKTRYTTFERLDPEYAISATRQNGRLSENEAVDLVVKRLPQLLSALEGRSFGYLVRHLGADRSVVTAALQRLRRRGLIENRGSSRSPIWWLRSSDERIRSRRLLG